MFDAERCILCTRCIRFLDEIAGTDEVSIDFRGESVSLIVGGDGNLTSPYQMNIIDICPVGALTSRDFRFKSRLWFMNFSNTVCTSCARGCNVIAGTRNDRVLRMIPRFNQDVNDHWMCDHGRLHYEFSNDEERITSASVAGKGAPYAVAIEAAAEILKGAETVAAVASPFMTNEELFALKGVLDHLGVEQRHYLKPMGEGDNLLVHPERCPNARGCELAGFTEGTPDGEIDALLYFVPREGADLPDEVLKAAKKTILFSLKKRDADVCLPLTTWIEKDGTVISAGDMLQRLSKGTTFEPTLLTERLVIDRLHTALDDTFAGADTASQAFARIEEFGGLTWAQVGLTGVTLKAGAPA